MKKDLISVIIPVYGDKSLVKMLYDRLINIFSKMTVEYEIIEVCDACPYGSADEIRKLAKKDKHIKFIELNRNYGQHIAIKAGLDCAKGDYAIVMDCDLQDNPEDIERLYNKIKKSEAEVIFGARCERKVFFLKKLYSKVANFFIYSLSDFYVPDMLDTGNFSIFSKKVLETLQESKDPFFVFRYIILGSGFKIDFIEVKQGMRAAGESGYNFRKGFNLFKNSLVSNSNKPLMFAGFCSFIMFVFCLLFIVKLLIDYFIFHQRFLGWTSIMVSIFFIASMLFGYLGVLGVYIGQIFKMSQGRKIYIVRKKMNL